MRVLHTDYLSRSTVYHNPNDQRFSDLKNNEVDSVESVHCVNRDAGKPKVKMRIGYSAVYKSPGM